MMVQAWKDKEGNLHDNEADCIQADKLHAFKFWYGEVDRLPVDHDFNIEAKDMFNWLLNNKYYLVSFLNDSVKGEG